MALMTEQENDGYATYHKYSWVIPVMLILITLGCIVAGVLIFLLATSSTLF